MPNKDKTIAAAQNRKGQATWRKKVKSYQEWKRDICWRNGRSTTCSTVTKQADGGMAISALEHTAEGDRITA